MNQASWKEQFTQKITGYDPVEAQGLSELGHAIISQQISESDYLSWAREKFEMMSVDMNFFQNYPVPLSLLKRLKESYMWGPEILPVAEWDGHLIVLCLERPKSEIPKELKPIVLLAPVSELQKYWQTFISEVEQPSVPSEAPAESLEAEGGMLEGISLEAPTAVTGLDFSGIKPQLPGEKTAITQITKLSKAIAKTKAPHPVEENTVKVEKTSLKEKTSTGISISKAPPVAPPVTEIAIEVNTVIKPKNHVPKIPNSIPVTPNPALVSQEKKAEPKVIAVVNPAALVSEGPILQTLQQVSEVYENRCYLEFNPSKNTVRAQLWPAEMNISVQPTDIDLTPDSFLKIVAKTQKPYHGYLVANETTEHFFKEMNRGEIPQNVTVVPIVKDGEVVGAIMGWGDKTKSSMTHLRTMEKHVHQLCLNLGFVTQEAAS